MHVLHIGAMVIGYCTNENADAEIATTVKMIAKTERAKITAKPGAQSDKTQINKPTTLAEDMFLVALTKFVMPDAKAYAEDAVRKEYKKRQQNLLAITTAMMVLIFVPRGRAIRAGLAMLIMIIGSLTREWRLALQIQYVIGLTPMLGKIAISAMVMYDKSGPGMASDKNKMTPLFYGLSTLGALLF